MPWPRIALFFLFFVAAPCLHADPLFEAEEAFLHEINGMPGIELVGGPFVSRERHHFGEESGYFVIGPSVPIPSLDQRLRVQTKLEEPGRQPSPELPVAVPPGPSPGALSAVDRRLVLELLAQSDYGRKRDEITLFADGTVQVRPVHHLPLVKLTPGGSNTCVALLGAQSWHGVPLYRASFDRVQGAFELELLRENFVPKRWHELRLRPFPVYSPQTFFAEPGLDRNDWEKLLRNFARIDLPYLHAIDALVTDRLVTVRADLQQPVLPKSWVKLRKDGTLWKVENAVDFRSEFPRPGLWWTFLPLLPPTEFNDVFASASSSVPGAGRLALGQIAQRLRGVGEVIEFTTLPDAAIRLRTAHNGWRGYQLDFRKMQDAWRLIGVTEWTD